MIGRGLAWLVIAWLVAPTTHASDMNYQDYLIGQRAMGMGGAFTALANDPSASWYNPGGLALMKRSSASASLGLYGVESRSVSAGFGNPIRTVDLDQRSFPIFQTTFGVAAKFGGGKGKPDRNAIGFSLLLPVNRSTGFTRVEQSGGEAAVYTLSESDRTLRVGPSYARSFGNDFALGFSLFYDYRSYSRRSEITGFLTRLNPVQPCEGAPTACSLASDINSTTGSLFLRLGALWKIDPRWRLGIAFSTPNLIIHGGATLFNRKLTASPEPGGVQFVGQGLTDLGTSNRRPFELRIGTAYADPPRFTFSVDVTIHGPARYSRVDTDTKIADPLFARVVNREPVVNFNIGAEFRPVDYLPVRLGLYTNFSSAPEIPDATQEAYLPREHLFGATASVGYLGDGYGLDFGVSVTFGSGVTQALDAHDPMILRRAETQSTLVYFFVSGLGQALAHNVRKLLKKFE